MYIEGYSYHRHRDQLPTVALMYPVSWNKLNVLLLKIVLYEYEANSSTEMKFTSSQPSRAHYNPTIIYFYQREQKPNSIRQSFWHASFVKFRQIFPPLKFYAIRYLANYLLMYCVTQTLQLLCCHDVKTFMIMLYAIITNKCNGSTWLILIFVQLL